MTDEQIIKQANKETLDYTLSICDEFLPLPQNGFNKGFIQGAQWHRDNADGWVKEVKELLEDIDMSLYIGDYLKDADIMNFYTRVVKECRLSIQELLSKLPEPPKE